VDETLTIGQLAQRFELKTSAIRYYERVGVLPEPARESGQRRYGADAIKRLEVLEVASAPASASTRHASCCTVPTPARPRSNLCASSRRASCPRSTRSSPGHKPRERGC
jgi:hypothetical protein